MSLSAAELVLEIATAHILPTLAVELGRVAFAHTTTRRTRSTQRARPPARSSRERVDASRNRPHLRLVDPDEHTVRVISSTPGRARVQIDGLRGSPNRAEHLVTSLRDIDGVTHVSVSPLTGTALMEFDDEITSLDRLLDAVLTHDRAARGNAPHGDRHQARPLRVVDSPERQRLTKAVTPPRLRVSPAQLPLAGI